MSIEFHRDGPWELPEGWVWARLGDLGRWTGGGTPSKSNLAFWTRGTIPWISPKDMKSEIVGDAEDWITENAVANSSTKRVAGGSILMVVRSGILNHTFPVAVCDREVTLNQDMRALTPREGIDSRYLANVLRRLQRHILYECSKDGTTVASVEPVQLENTFVPIAPLAEQRRIVARIDELFTEIADGEAALARARDDLDTWRRALLKAAVTGELTREWREQNTLSQTGQDVIENARVALHTASPFDRCLDKTIQLDTSSLPEMPDGWAWATLGELLSLVTSGSRGWKKYYASEGASFIRAQNINSGILDLSDVAHVRLPSRAEGLRTKLVRGDVLVTITGANVTVSALADQDLPEAYVNQHVALLRPIEPGLARYILLWLHAEGAGKTQLVNAAYGAGKPGLNLNNIREVSIAVPPLVEAVEIANSASDLLATVADTLFEMETGIASSLPLRQSILKAAFEGRLVAQDPRDESAERLLARLSEQTEPPAQSRAKRQARRAAQAVQER